MEMVLIFTFCLILAGTDAVTTVTGYRGRSVQIKCHYTSEYENNKKYLCRGECPSWPGSKDIPVDSKSHAEGSRFSLHDDTTAKVFTVTITDLRPEDAEKYWCGIEKSLSDIYTEILLLVRTDAPTISATISAVSHTTHTTHATSTQSVSPSVHAENPHSTTGISISPIITAVSVVLVLLLIVLSIIVIIQRKKKTRGFETVTQSPRETNEDSENDPNFLTLTARENDDSSESVYQSLNSANNQSYSVYQSLTLTSNN